MQPETESNGYSSTRGSPTESHYGLTWISWDDRQCVIVLSQAVLHGALLSVAIRHKTYPSQRLHAVYIIILSLCQRCMRRHSCRYETICCTWEPQRWTWIGSTHGLRGMSVIPFF